MRYNAKAEYAPGKTLVLADTLSRGPAASTRDSNTEADVCCYVNSIVSTLPESRGKLDEITLTDSEFQAVVMLVRKGWPDHAKHLPPSARDYSHHKGGLSESDKLVTMGSRYGKPRAERRHFMQSPLGTPGSLQMQGEGKSLSGVAWPIS